MLDPAIAARLHARGLVGRNAYPFDDRDVFGVALPGAQAEQLAAVLSDRVYLVFAGALTTATALHDLRPGVTFFALREERHGRETLALASRAAHEVCADVPGADDGDGERQHIRRHQPVQMLVDGLWLPARVGENRAVGHRLDLAMRGHQRHCRGLHAGAKGEDVDHGPAALLIALAGTRNGGSPSSWRRALQKLTSIAASTSPRPPLRR